MESREMCLFPLERRVSVALRCIFYPAARCRAERLPLAAVPRPLVPSLPNSSAQSAYFWGRTPMVAPQTPNRGHVASAQFDATKHSWRGKYSRTIVLGQGHLVTHDPVGRPPNSLGRQTNSWPVAELGLVDRQGCIVWLKLRTAKHWWQNMLVFHLVREEEATRLIRRLGQARC